MDAKPYKYKIQVLNVSILNEAWNQVTLPVAKGGIGMRRATLIASVIGSQSLVAELLPARLHHISGTYDPLFMAVINDWQSRTDSLHVQMPVSSAQNNWDKVLVDIQEKNVLSAAPDQASKARLIASAASHSGALQHARLCSSLDTRLVDSSLRISEVADPGTGGAGGPPPHG
jgi:hypothetical protein